MIHQMRLSVVVVPLGTFPIFARVAGGAWGQQIQEFDRKAHEANASPGAHSEAPGQSPGSRVPAAPDPKPENQDGQHKLDQPRVVKSACS